MLWSLFFALLLLGEPLRAAGLESSIQGYPVRQLLAGIEIQRINRSQATQLAKLIYLRSQPALLRSCGASLADMSVPPPSRHTLWKEIFEIRSEQNGKKFASLTETEEGFLVTVPFPFDPRTRTLNDVMSGPLDEKTRLGELEFLKANVEAVLSRIHSSIALTQQRLEEWRRQRLRVGSPRTRGKDLKSRISELTKYMKKNKGELPTWGPHYLFFYSRCRKVRAGLITAQEAFAGMPPAIQEQALRQFESLCTRVSR
jgi:hypothetical protein